MDSIKIARADRRKWSELLPYPFNALAGIAKRRK